MAQPFRIFQLLGASLAVLVFTGGAVAQPTANPFSSTRPPVTRSVAIPPPPPLLPPLTGAEPAPVPPTAAPLEAHRTSPSLVSCGMEFVSPPEYNLSSVAQEISVQLTAFKASACLAAASTEVSWLTAEVGSFRKSVVLKVDENTEAEPRDAVVTLVAGSQILKVKVKQAGAKPRPLNSQ